ncbi:uncharacterized protein LOC108455691 [Gossypium arboreum]|uniref:uncharacterized protein LOC108455691 n=1 Tax=Gossypium arboreum TaxID=29729 RepID=UPI0008190BDD|nr:uncharacterized protein LOC108455691 [Gossypium arboreum]
MSNGFEHVDQDEVNNRAPTSEHVTIGRNPTQEPPSPTVLLVAPSVVPPPPPVIESDKCTSVEKLRMYGAKEFWNQIDLKCQTREMILVESENPKDIVRIISAFSAQRLMRKGNDAFLAYILDTWDLEPKLDQLPIFSEFADVFLEELPGLPPDREVEFVIDVIPRTALISVMTYCKTPAKLKELKAQLSSKLQPKFCQKVFNDYFAVDPIITENVEFFWSNECQQSFDQLKKMLTEVPVLTQPESGVPYVVYNDMSLNGLGCANVVADALSQKSSLFTVRALNAHLTLNKDGSILAELRRKPLFLQQIWELQDDNLKLVLKRQMVQDNLGPEYSIDDSARYEMGNLGICSKMFDLSAAESRTSSTNRFTTTCQIPEWKWEHVTMYFAFDLKRRDIKFAVGDQVFLKVSLWKKVLRFGRKGKLSLRFIGSYEIVERIDLVAYRLALPPELEKIHNVFHVSMLRWYRSDPSHVIPHSEIELQPHMTYLEEPVRIVTRKVEELRNKRGPLVKVLWHRHGSEEANWEVEESMRLQ